MPSEAVLYTAPAAVLRHRQDAEVEPRGSAAVEAGPPARKIPQLGGGWRPISCGARAQIHICAEIDHYTSEAHFGIVVWVLKSGTVIVNDFLCTGCSWWRSAQDNRTFRRLAGVDNHTYGFQFHSYTKAVECSRVMDHILTNTPGALKVVKKLMRDNVDLQSLVLAWQGVGLHSMHYPSRARKIHSEMTSPAPSSRPKLRNDRRTGYPKEHKVNSGSLWDEEQQQQQATSGQVMPIPTCARSSTICSKEASYEDNNQTDEMSYRVPASLSDENSVDNNQTDEISNRARIPPLASSDDNQTDDMSNIAPTSPVALLEISGAADRFGVENKQFRGEWISRPYKTREEIHVTYNPDRARYEGLPDEWRMLNHQFGLPLEEVPKRVVNGYDTKLPAVLEMMKSCLLAHNGAQTEGIFRVAPDKLELVAVKHSINDGTFEDCSDVHIMASLIKLWFRELPVSLLNMLPEAKIALACQLVDPEPKMVLKTLSALPKLHQSVLLWLLDLLNEVVQYEDKNKMTTKSMAIVMAPNLFSVESSDPAVVVAAYRQAADFVLLLLHARSEQKKTERSANSFLLISE